jgi:hypothetical protein
MRASAAILGACVAHMAFVGCATAPPHRRVATPAELSQMGTRTYAGYSNEQVRRAALTALKVQGYEIVTEEPRIRTSPKLVNVTGSVSGGAGSVTYAANTNTYAEAVAWDIDVNGGSAGPTLRAVPRASVNGMAMDQMYYEYAVRTFSELMREIDSSLPPKQ